MKFKDKIILVTGASRGIGLSIIKEFAEREAIVIGTSTTKKGSETISKFLGKKGKGIELNICNKECIQSLLKKINQEFGTIDILVNNVGIISDNILIRMKEHEWSSVINVNLTSIFYISKYVIKSMIKNNYGRIINIGSVVGFMGNIGQTNYASAKAGLIGFSKSLALEVASLGITVNTVSPGFIYTDMTKKFSTDYYKKCLLKIPMKRFGKSKEVASAVIFLASEAASYITGETIHVNGGMYMV